MEKKVNDNQPKVKRTYQDSLFRFLFGNKESAIELYNALEGTDYGMDTEVEFTTLDILRDFLIQYGKEVRGMLFDDITIEEFAEIRGDERWEEGRQQGIQQGEEAMQERMNRLFKLMLADERLAEFEKSTEDKDFQQILFEEYGI